MIKDTAKLWDSLLISSFADFHYQPAPRINTTYYEDYLRWRTTISPFFRSVLHPPAAAFQAAKSALAALAANPAPNAVLSLATDASYSHVVRGKLAAVAGSPSLSYPRLNQEAVGAGGPLLHLRPSAPSATFVSRARICKPFEGAQESISSLAGRYDNPNCRTGHQAT